MNPFATNILIKRLDQMIENAINDRDIEKDYDESKVSALETKLNRYLIMSKTKSDQLEEEKMKIKELISDISHQTKTPIANLTLYSSLLLEQDDLSNASMKMVNEINRQSKKLEFLITSLIKTSRLETGIITVNPINSKVSPMILEVMDQIKPYAEGKNIKITYQANDVQAIYDYKWTCEAIYNIVDNAVKYTKENDVIQIKVTSYDLFVRIDIKDNGIGISFEEQCKIFSRFYRSQAVAHQEGVGIGLYLAREIVERQGGYIKVDASPNEGATFSVFLPRV